MQRYQLINPLTLSFCNIESDVSIADTEVPGDRGANLPNWRCEFVFAREL